MPTVQIVNVTKGVVVAQKGQLATSIWPRLKGLLGRSGLADNEALVLKPCSSIHTFFMRFTIDVVFLNKKMQIVKLTPNIPPNRLGPIVWRSHLAIELPAGKIDQTNTQIGDIIEFK